ncbi:MAG: hypothetical protein AAGF23_01765 [Acidobacteriota bacterium]
MFKTHPSPRCSWLAAFFVLALAAAVPPAADAGGARGHRVAPHPDAAPELAQFAFLIGHWRCDVDFIGGDWKTRHRSTAEWTAYYIQDGRAIMDDFRGGFGENYFATTIRVYDRLEKGWRGYWIDGQGGRWSRPLEGRPTDGGMLLETTMAVRSPDGDALDVDLQYEFHDIEADRFRWSQHSSLDGGETWRKETTRMDCKRRGGPATRPDGAGGG